MRSDDGCREKIDAAWDALVELTEPAHEPPLSTGDVRKIHGALVAICDRLDSLERLIHARTDKP